MVLHLQVRGGLCRFWGGENNDGKGGHHGCDDREFRPKTPATKNEYRGRRSRASERRWLGAGSNGSRPATVTLETPADAIRLCGRRRRAKELHSRRLAAHLFDMDALDEDEKAFVGLTAPSTRGAARYPSRPEDASSRGRVLH